MKSLSEKEVKFTGSPVSSIKKVDSNPSLNYIPASNLEINFNFFVRKDVKPTDADDESIAMGKGW